MQGSPGCRQRESLQGMQSLYLAFAVSWLGHLAATALISPPVLGVPSPHLCSLDVQVAAPPALLLPISWGGCSS